MRLQCSRRRIHIVAGVRGAFQAVVHRSEVPGWQDGQKSCESFGQNSTDSLGFEGNSPINHEFCNSVGRFNTMISAGLWLAPRLSSANYGVVHLWSALWQKPQVKRQH
ncbi:MAG: hypothetical protein B7Y73_09255 [Acidocella sp. 35-58-6]|nr:MAG: hypothetical protein B7Y73_09255 [Acidocella sp. 35-58-6]